MESKYSLPPARLATATSDDIAAAFLAQKIFVPGEIRLVASDTDRVIIGGAVPGAQSLKLLPPENAKLSCFAERREIGVVNLGVPGRVRAGGKNYDLANRDALYIGAGTEDIIFSEGGGQFYFVSYPTAQRLPIVHVPFASVKPMALGEPVRANQRCIYKLICPETAASSQLVLGLTEIAPNSVWNTMPCHTHDLRSEVYFYFGLGDAVVFHGMGQPNDLRQVVVRDQQAVFSPSWSVHFGCGTRNYSFIWAMGGENQDFADMKLVAMESLR